METTSTPQDAAAGPERSPRAAGEPAICDPGCHVSGPWCSRCGQWFVDGEWRNTPPETTRSPKLLDGRIKEAVHMTADPINLTGPLETSCRYAPPIERNAVRVVWSPIVTTDPAQVTCAQCSKRLEGKPLAAGGYVSGSQPVLVGEKDGPFLPLADHAELARGKTPEHMLDRGLEEAIDTAYADGSIFSESSRDPADDAMLSEQVQERPAMLVVTGSSDHFSPLFHQMYPELRLNEFSRLMEQAALRCYERASSLDAEPRGRITFTIVAEQITTPKED